MHRLRLYHRRAQALSLIGDVVNETFDTFTPKCRSSERPSWSGVEVPRPESERKTTLSSSLLLPGRLTDSQKRTKLML